MKQLKAGIIGTGFISAAYLRAAADFPQVAIVTCADAVPANAEKRAQEFGLSVQSVGALLADPAVDLVINLTTPQHHAAIILEAIRHGKHVYSEKPLGLSTSEAAPLVQTAAAQGVRLGCAPDTFLGGGQQTARKLIDDGAIGRPFGGTAFIQGPGHERWHPNPEFYYLKGGGPVFDMGPYYLTALINLLGPVIRVTALGRKAAEERTILAGPRQGSRFPVEVPTHLQALLEFAQGSIVTFHASFDVEGHAHPPLEIYGTAGTLEIPDPNTFGGNVRLLATNQSWTDVPLTHPFADRNYRMLGVAEIAEAIQAERPHRATAELAFHVLEVMEAITEGSRDGQPRTVHSSCDRPRPLPGLPRLGGLD